MDKINFEDLPSEETPINANNLNQMQDNIENGINVNSERLNELLPKQNSDGEYDILVAEITFDEAYQRSSLVFSSVLVGSSDNTDTGIVLVALSANDQIVTSVANTAITVLGNTQVYVVTEGANAKVYVKKTTYYRTLHLALINKTDDVVWYGH